MLLCSYFQEFQKKANACKIRKVNAWDVETGNRGMIQNCDPEQAGSSYEIR